VAQLPSQKSGVRGAGVHRGISEEIKTIAESLKIGLAMAVGVRLLLYHD